MLKPNFPSFTLLFHVLCKKQRKNREKAKALTLLLKNTFYNFTDNLEKGRCVLILFYILKKPVSQQAPGFYFSL